jgi:hypothetical protein
VYDVIVDNPYESTDDIAQTLELVGSLPSSAYIFLFSLTFYKNTLLYEKAKADCFDVDAHLTKSQGHYNSESKENKLVQLALFFPPGWIRWLLRTEGRAAGWLVHLMFCFSHCTLEPLRAVKLAFLSQQEHPMRFFRLLLTFSRQFVSAIYLRRSVGSGFRETHDSERRPAAQRS